MKVFNSLTRRKEKLETITPGEVKMYVCGPTVYNFFHLGNARPFITYDTLRRYLEHIGYRVTFVQNFTDIDDKMINGAKEKGVSVRELADEMIEEYFRDADALNIKRATFHPRATEHIDDILEIVQMLYDKGYAYVLDDGVYFDLEKDKSYGKLSGKNLDDLIAGASERVANIDDKKSPYDFALWKFKKEGEPSWPSPWGAGRPGWHIECSAMSRCHLGDTFDIHCGGVDLIFPHHENEIAQSECATGKPFVKYWLHNGFINVDNEKMSKSLGNFFLVRELVTKYPYHIIRYFVLLSHYRMPINFSGELLDAASTGWQRICTCVNNLKFVAAEAPIQAVGETAEEAERTLSAAIKDCEQDWNKGMSDDLNTADAIAAIFNLVRAANTAAAVEGISAGALTAAADKITELLGVMGLVVEEQGDGSEIPQDILDKVELRTKAKKDKNYALADRLRDEITAAGYKIEDTPQGPKVIPQR